MSSIIIVTRHNGAIEWLRSQQVEGKVFSHLLLEDVANLPPQSIIVGVLPLPIVVAAIQAGHRFLAVQLNLPVDLRGCELTAEQMDRVASLQELQLQWNRIDGKWQSDGYECRSGVPEPSAGDMQRFRIGLVPRTAGDIVEHLAAVAEGQAVNAAAYQQISTND